MILIISIKKKNEEKISTLTKANHVRPNKIDVARHTFHSSSPVGKYKMTYLFCEPVTSKSKL